MKRLLVAAMLLLAGCGTGPTSGGGTHSYRLFVEKLGSGGLSVVTTSAPGQSFLPGGFLTADGTALFSSGGQVFDRTSGSLGTTTVNVFDTRSGALARQLQLAGQWSWVDGGSSPDGRWIVLTAPQGFLVVDTTTGRPYPVTLAGHFNFDALSNDGQRLYFLQTLGGSAYQVRLAHVFTNAVEPGAVLIKGPEVEAMNGYKLTAVAGPGGHMLYSLYGRDDGRPPFVHALDLDQGVAYCVDLPAIAAQGVNYPNAATSGWSLSLDAVHHMLYASSVAGEVVAIDTNQNEVMRSAGLAAPSSTAFLPWFTVDAKAKALEGLPAASALDGDGHRLYVAWESGFLAVDTATLRPSALRDAGDHLTSLALSPDGLHLFGISSPDALVDLDPLTGNRLAMVGGLTAPWRIVRLEPAG